MLSKIQRWNVKFNRSLAIAAALFVAAMALATIIDVGGRYLFNNPLQGSVEISTEMLVMIVFLGFAYVQTQRRHIRLEFLMEKLSPKAQDVLNVISDLFILATASFLAWRCVLKAEYSWAIGEISPGIVPIPFAPARTIVALGFTLFAITVILQLIERFAKSNTKT